MELYPLGLLNVLAGKKLTEVAAEPAPVIVVVVGELEQWLLLVLT